MKTHFQKGDIVIRAYHHDPEEWGIIIGFEIIDLDPQDDPEDDILEFIYVTVLWPDSYTTQEMDYELWTPEEADNYSVKCSEKQSKK